MAKTTAQKEAANWYYNQERDLEEQARARSSLYGVWKALRDVEDTGDSELNAIRDQMYEICKEVPYRVSLLDKN